MGSVSGVRSGLQTRLQTISGLNAYANAPGTVTVPAAVVIPASPAIEWDETMARGSDLMSFAVLVLVARTTDGLAQDHLDPYLAGSGSTSIKAAIEGDGTLGGAADWTHVTSVSTYGDIDYNGISYLGARFNVEVNVDGS